MNIALIGCGKVGLTLCHFLKKRHPVIGIHDTDPGRQRAAARILGIRNNPSYPSMIGSADFVLIATPDDQIARASSKAVRHLKKRALIGHCSGVLPAEVIPRNPLALRASLHPFATFPVLILPPRDRKFIILAQGDRTALRAAARFFDRKYFLIETIDRRRKVWCHLLGIFGSNLLVGLMKAASDIAARTGAGAKQRREMILSIANHTLANIAAFGLERALSGPIRRGDVSTVRRHLRALGSRRNLLRTYCALSRHLTGFSPNRGKRRILDKLLNRAG